METRRIKTNEWQIFKSLRLAALKQDGGQFGQSYDDMVKHSDKKWKEDTLSAAESDEFFIILAFDDRKAIGMSGCIRVEDFGKIIALWVEPSYRGKGIGHILVKETMNIVKSPKYKLTIVDDNQPAIKIYKNLGFTISGFSYVNDKGFREIEMIKELNKGVDSGW